MARRIVNIVMPSQLQTLPRFQAYVKFSGDWPVTKIKTQYKERPEVAPYSIERRLPPAFRVLKEANSKDTDPAQTESVSGFEVHFRKGEPLI